MATSKTNPAFMNGVPELLVLRLLSEREMYGYQLVQAIALASGNALRLGEGVVYPALHSLELAGCLRSSRKAVNGRVRVYYTVTAAGRKRLRAVVADWSRVTKAVLGVVEGARDEA